MVVDKDLPWLQDTPTQAVWSSWEPNYRDVFVLDDQNHFVSAFNLTMNQLSDVGNREALKVILIGDQVVDNDSGSP